MSSPKSEYLVCPAGHGPQPADAIFCWACGKHLEPPGLAFHDPIRPGAQTLNPTAAVAGTVQQTPSQMYSATPPLVSPPGLQTGPVRPVTHAVACATCGGDGSRLEASKDFCNHCRKWLPPTFVRLTRKHQVGRKGSKCGPQELPAGEFGATAFR